MARASTGVSYTCRYTKKKSSSDKNDRSGGARQKSNGGGCIVNMLSILSHVALPLMGSLCASKAATLRLTEGVRAELDASNTLVIAVMPGAVDTDMSRDFPPPKMPAAQVAKAVLDGIVEGQEELFPGEMASGLREGLKADPKGVEKELAGYLPG